VSEQRDPERQPRPIICRHQMFLWPWKAKPSTFVIAYLCAFCFGCDFPLSHSRGDIFPTTPEPKNRRSGGL
jgi:hypothetical protein